MTMQYTPGSTELDPRLQRFCQLYAQSGNGYQSARQAGFSPHIARDIKRCIFNQPGVIDYIAHLNKEVEISAVASIEEIQSRLTRVIRKQDDELDKDFIPEDYWFKTVDMLNKMKGAYIERQSVNISQDDTTINVNHTIVEKRIDPLPEPTKDESVVVGDWNKLTGKLNE